MTSEWFMETASWAFEQAAPGENTFVGVGFDTALLHLADGSHVREVAADRSGLDELDALVAQSRVTVFHNVSPSIAGVLAVAPDSVVRVWSGWGGDYYGTTLDRWAGLLGRKTRQFVYGSIRPTYWLGRAREYAQVQPKLRSAARAADVFSAPIPEDLNVFRRRFPGFRGRYNQLNYVTLEDSIATGSGRLSGRDILLGNSSSPSNNHLETIELLGSLDLNGRRVLTPLSYGDPDYAAVVIEMGRRVLGDQFVPITGFLPLDEYNEILSTCGITMFGAFRQEGLGNILRAIWQGSHLFLDRRNPVVDYLRARGVEVSVLDDLPESGLPSEPVGEAQLAAGRQFLEAYWSRAAVVANVRALLAFADG